MMSSTSRTSSSAMLADRSLMIRTSPDDSVAVAAVGADLHEVDPQRQRDLAHEVGHERQRALEHATRASGCGRRSPRRCGGRARRPWRRSAASVSRTSPMSACRSSGAGHGWGRRCLRAGRARYAVDHRASGGSRAGTGCGDQAGRGPGSCAGARPRRPRPAPARRRRRPGPAATATPAAARPVVRRRDRRPLELATASASAASDERSHARPSAPRRPASAHGRGLDGDPRGGVAWPVVPVSSSSSASRPNLSSSIRKSRA